MANNRRLIDLRDSLFEQLDRLKNAENPDVEIRRAQAMSNLSAQIIGSTKVQLEFIKTLGRDRAPALTEQTSEFFRGDEPQEKGLNTGKQLGTGTATPIRAAGK